jgi:hypothetical protein
MRPAMAFDRRVTIPLERPAITEAAAERLGTAARGDGIGATARKRGGGKSRLSGRRAGAVP